MITVQKRKIFSIFAIVGSPVLICGLLWYLVFPWNPAVSHDTFHYYYPAQTTITPLEFSWFDTLSPFYLPSSSQRIFAEESKPVFVLTIKIWGFLYNWATGFTRPPPHEQEYMLFMLLSCLFLAFIIILIGHQLGNKWIGLFCCLLVLVNPWHLIFLYLPAYTQISMFFYLCAFYAILKKTFLGSFSAGILCCLAILANNSMIVYLLGLGIGLFYIHLPKAKNSFISSFIFLGGFFSLFLFFELFKYSDFVFSFYSSYLIDSPLTTLIKYYKVSIYQNHFGEVNVPKYYGMMFLILWHTSRILFWFSLFGFLWFFLKILIKGWTKTQNQTLQPEVAPLWFSFRKKTYAFHIHPGPLWRKTYPFSFPIGKWIPLLWHNFLILSKTGAFCFRYPLSIIKKGWEENNKDESFYKTCLLWFPVFVAVVVIDFRPGVQFGRSYFIGYPLFIMGFLFLFASHQKLLAKRNLFLLFLFFLYSTETFFQLKEQKNTFHSLSQVCSLLQGENKIAILEEDHHNMTFQMLLDSQCPSDKGKYVILPEEDHQLFGNKKFQYLITGPKIGSILSHAPSPELLEKKWTGIFGHHAPSKGNFVLEPPQVLPFWGLFPLLMFEDEIFTWKYLRGEFDSDDFKQEIGGISVWPFSPISIEQKELNEDQHPDVLFFDTTGENKAELLVSLSSNQSYSKPEKWISHGHSSKEQLIYGDFNGDQKEDIAYFDPHRSNGIWVNLIQNSKLSPTKDWVRFGGLSQPNYLRIGDINGDGMDDAIYLDSLEAKQILVALSTGVEFKKPEVWLNIEISSPHFWHIAELNGDNKKDLIYLSLLPNGHIQIFVSLSTGFLFLPPKLWFSSNKIEPELFRLSDVNKDNKTDLLLYDRLIAKKNLVFYSDGSGFRKREEDFYSNHFKPVPFTTGKEYFSGGNRSMVGSWWEIEGNYPLDITLELSNKKISGYYLQASDASGRMPTGWFFQGSKNSIDWINLDYRTNQDNWKAREKKIYPLKSPQSFRYYRFKLIEGKRLIRLYKLGMLYSI